jgi:hypothetical protein
VCDLRESDFFPVQFNEIWVIDSKIKKMRIVVLRV